MEKRSEKHYEQWFFTLSIIFLTGFLGGVSGLLVTLVIFSKMCPAQLPFFAPLELTTTPAPVVVIVTATPPPTPTATLPPTETPAPPTGTPTLVASPSPTPTLTVTATRVFVPPPPTPTIPPSVYVTSVKTDPSPAKQKQDVLFRVTFLNTTGQDRTYRWFVYIYDQSQSNPVGQTSSDKEFVIPPGTSEQVTINAWRYGPGEPCTTYIAKIHWVNQDGSKPTFGQVGGAQAAFPFMLCP